jgi:hypothetical protein
MLHETVINLTVIEKTQPRNFSSGRVTIILDYSNGIGDFLQLDGNADMSALLLERVPVRAKCSDLELVGSVPNAGSMTIAMQIARSRLHVIFCHFLSLTCH